MTTTNHRPTTGASDSTDDRSADAAAYFENLRVKGDAMAAKVKALIHEGNVRRIVVKNAEGHALIEIPVNAGLVAAAVAPVLTGVAAIAALANDWQIDVHRDTDRFVG